MVYNQKKDNQSVCSIGPHNLDYININSSMMDV